MLRLYLSLILFGLSPIAGHSTAKQQSRKPLNVPDLTVQVEQLQVAVAPPVSQSTHYVGIPQPIRILAVKQIQYTVYITKQLQIWCSCFNPINLEA